MDRNKAIRWDATKNLQLQERYGIGFEAIIEALGKGQLLDNRCHPNQAKYGHQNQLIVAIHDYAYVVPYIDERSYWFLKTFFPSRQATRDYIH